MLTKAGSDTCKQVSSEPFLCQVCSWPPADPCLHSSPALAPLLRHVAHRDQLTPPVPSHSREHSHVTFLISALDSVWSSSRDCSSLIFSPSSSLSCTHLAFEDTRLGAKCKKYRLE